MKEDYDDTLTGLEIFLLEDFPENPVTTPFDAGFALPLPPVDSASDKKPSSATDSSKKTVVEPPTIPIDMMFATMFGYVKESANLKQVVAERDKKIEELTSAAESSTMIQQLEEKIASQNATIAEMTTTLEEKSVECSLLQSKAEEISKEKTEAERALSKTKQNFQDINKNLEVKTAEVDKFHILFKNKEKECKHLNQKVNSFKERELENSQKLAAAQSELLTLGKKHEEESLSSLKELASLKAQLAANKTSEKESRQTLLEENSRIEVLKASYEGNLKKMTDELNKLRQFSSGATVDRENFEEQLRKKQNEIEHYRKNYQSKMEQQQKVSHQHKIELEKLQQAYKKLQKQHVASSLVKKRLQEKYDAHKAEKEAEIDSLKKKVSAKDYRKNTDNLEKLQEEFDKLEKQYNEALASKNRLLERRGEQKNSLAVLEKKIKASGERMAEYAEKLRNATEKLRDSQQKLAVSRKELSLLKEKLKESEATIVSQKKVIVSTKNKLNQLEVKFAELQKMIPSRVAASHAAGEARTKWAALNPYQQTVMRIYAAYRFYGRSFSHAELGKFLLESADIAFKKIVANKIHRSSHRKPYQVGEANCIRLLKVGLRDTLVIPQVKVMDKVAVLAAMRAIIDQEIAAVVLEKDKESQAAALANTHVLSTVVEGLHNAKYHLDYYPLAFACQNSANQAVLFNYFLYQMGYIHSSSAVYTILNATRNYKDSSTARLFGVHTEKHLAAVVIDPNRYYTGNMNVYKVDVEKIKELAERGPDEYKHNYRYLLKSIQLIDKEIDNASTSYKPIIAQLMQLCENVTVMNAQIYRVMDSLRFLALIYYLQKLGLRPQGPHIYDFVAYLQPMAKSAVRSKRSVLPDLFQDMISTDANISHKKGKFFFLDMEKFINAIQNEDAYVVEGAEDAKQIYKPQRPAFVKLIKAIDEEIEQGDSSLLSALCSSDKGFEVLKKDLAKVQKDISLPLRTRHSIVVSTKAHEPVLKKITLRKQIDFFEGTLKKRTTQLQAQAKIHSSAAPRAPTVPRATPGSRPLAAGTVPAVTPAPAKRLKKSPAPVVATVSTAHKSAGTPDTNVLSSPPTASASKDITDLVEKLTTSGRLNYLPVALRKQLCVNYRPISLQNFFEMLAPLEKFLLMTRITLIVNKKAPLSLELINKMADTHLVKKELDEYVVLNARGEVVSIQEKVAATLPPAGEASELSLAYYGFLALLFKTDLQALNRLCDTKQKHAVSSDTRWAKLIKTKFAQLQKAPAAKTSVTPPTRIGESLVAHSMLTKPTRVSKALVPAASASTEKKDAGSAGQSSTAKRKEPSSEMIFRKKKTVRQSDTSSQTPRLPDPKN